MSLLDLDIFNFATLMGKKEYETYTDVLENTIIEFTQLDNWNIHTKKFFTEIMLPSNKYISITSSDLLWSI